MLEERTAFSPDFIIMFDILVKEPSQSNFSQRKDKTLNLIGVRLCKAVFLGWEFISFANTPNSSCYCYMILALCEQCSC